MRGDSDCLCACFLGSLQVCDGAYAREQQHGRFTIFDLRCRCLDELHLVSGRESVVVARAAQSVAVRDLYELHAAFVQAGRYLLDLFRRKAVPDCVASVAECGVHKYYSSVFHYLLPPSASILSAIFSAAATAAELMISRFPEYAGRKSACPSTCAIVVTLSPSIVGGTLS